MVKKPSLCFWLTYQVSFRYLLLSSSILGMYILQQQIGMCLFISSINITSMSDSQQDNKPNHTRKLGNKEYAQYLKSQPTTTTYIFNIEKFLSKFDPFYYNAFLSKIKARPLEKVQKELQREYENLLQGKSFFHKMNIAIQSRKKCIDKIKRELTKIQYILKAFKKVYFKKNSQKDEIVMEYTEGQGFTMVDIDESIENSIKMIYELFADMNRLRDMTIYLIQTIHRWRVDLEEWMDKCGHHSRVDYYYEGKVFYHMLYDDTNFIWESKLSEYIWLQHKQDPLIIRNVLTVQEKQEREILEKYFIETLFPKSQQTIEKAIKCLEMLQFEYKPKEVNLYEEEEKLIENYLNLERKNNEEAGLYQDPVQQAKQLRKQIEKDNYIWYDREAKKNKKGWVFGKKLQKPASQKVRAIVNKHQKQMQYLGKHKLKPYNITNYGEKNSIALAYMDEKKKIQSLNPYGRVRNLKNIIYSEDETELYSQQKKEEKANNQNPRLYQSLIKLNNVIIPEDPKEYQVETPRKKHKKVANEPKLNKSRGRETINHHIKINTLVTPVQQEGDKKPEIQIDGEEAPMNLKQFFQVFRADTYKSPPKQHTQRVLQKHSLKGSFSVKKIINRKRAQSFKPYKKKKPALKKLQKEKSQKSIQSFGSFTKVEGKSLTESKIVEFVEKQFISLESKRITSDMIGMYCVHIMNHLPLTSKSFTNYTQLKLIKLLEDRDIHSMIFDLYGEKDGHLGQAIVVENLTNRMRLRYQIEFINIGNFEMLLSGISRVSEELLATSPCEQVICRLTEDKLDPVSTHFIQLIDQGLRVRGQKFSLFHIMEKRVPGYVGKDMYQRIYIFQSKKNMIKEKLYRKKMMSNYRSLTFQTKCLLLSSNFKLRSQNLTKDIIQSYKDFSIGSLYVKILSRIMNKHNLKQLKIASLSIDDKDETVNVIKGNPFLRTLFSELLHYSKAVKQSENQSQWLKVSLTKFNSMTDLLNYLNYREYDELFKFDFLNESRFILNHQLHISQVNLNFSMEFTVVASPSMLMLNNHRNFTIHAVQHDETVAYILPTIQDSLKLIIMDGREYENFTDKLDMFTYLHYFFKDNPKKEVHDVPQIVFPNITKLKPKVHNIKAYEGLSRLFPQRQFYSATMMAASNLWQGFYPSAVISLPQKDAIILEYPLIIGFYDASFEEPIVAFLYRESANELSSSKLVIK